MTIKARFAEFTKNIKPTPEHIEEANRQTDYMISQLKNKVSADGTFTLEKILRAGSNAKFTSLRKTDENLFDVDLGAYYSGKGAKKAELDRLLQFTHKCLVEIYSQKDKKEQTKSSKIPATFQPDVVGDHNALNDARAQAKIFEKMLTAKR